MTADIHVLEGQHRLLAERVSTSFDGGDGGGYDDFMEKRVEKLEEFVDEAHKELRAIDVRLATIETTLGSTATKSDIKDSANDLIKWVVGTGVGLGVAAIVIMTFVLNNAAPKAVNAPAAPIIITVPAATPAPVAPAVAPK